MSLGNMPPWKRHMWSTDLPHHKGIRTKKNLQIFTRPATISECFESQLHMPVGFLSLSIESARRTRFIIPSEISSQLFASTRFFGFCSYWSSQNLCSDYNCDNPDQDDQDDKGAQCRAGPFGGLTTSASRWDAAVDSTEGWGDHGKP